MRRIWSKVGGVRGALLLASLCLNVLLIAYIGTQWYRTARVILATAAPPYLIEFVASRLPRADADILWRVYRSKEQALSAAQADYRQSLSAARQLLSQPELDVAAFRATVQQARDKRLKVGDIAIETFLEALPQMSAEGRRGLAGSISPD